MSVEEKEEDDEWNHGVDEDEFAYDGYARNDSTKDRKQPAAPTDANAAGVARDRDGFLGKHCPICLGGISRSSCAIDSCKHIYCTSCLSEWLKVSDRCPLCKINVSVVIYDIKSPKDYKTYVHAPNSSGGGKSGGASLGEASSGEPAGTAAGESLGAGRGAEFRAVVYRRDLAAEPPAQKARRPKSLDQLRPWIVREVQAAAPSGAAGGTIDTRLVVDIVEALLASNDLETQEGYCAVKEQSFLFENTAPFLHELWCFRWSKERIPAYDRDTVYTPRPSPR